MLDKPEYPAVFSKPIAVVKVAEDDQCPATDTEYGYVIRCERKVHPDGTWHDGEVPGKPGARVQWRGRRPGWTLEDPPAVQRARIQLQGLVDDWSGDLVLSAAEVVAKIQEVKATLDD